MLHMHSVIIVHSHSRHACMHAGGRPGECCTLMRECAPQPLPRTSTIGLLLCTDSGASPLPLPSTTSAPRWRAASSERCFLDRNLRRVFLGSRRSVRRAMIAMSCFACSESQHACWVRAGTLELNISMQLKHASKLDMHLSTTFDPFH